LVQPHYLDVSSAHAEGEKIKKIINNSFSDDIIFTVHTDECHHTFCQHCNKKDCPDRKSAYIAGIDWNVENLVKESIAESMN
jgi:hypothetical protein